MIGTVVSHEKTKHYKKILLHEHIQCASNDMLKAFGTEWYDRERLIDLASGALRKLHSEYGVDCIVDGTPIDLGRDIGMLREVSERSGVDIVASTGLYYFPNCFTLNRTENEIAEWFIREFENGAEGTGIRPGILKCASDADGITECNRKRLRAAAIAQKTTGLPVYVHSNHDEGLAEQQLNILLEVTDAPEKILLGHCGLRAETGYFAKLLERGCYLVFDQCHCSRYSVAQICKTIFELCVMGYGDRLLLSNDQCIYSDFAGNETNGLQLSAKQHCRNLAYVLTDVFEGFAGAGGTAEQWEKMLGINAVRALC